MPRWGGNRSVSVWSMSTANASATGDLYSACKRPTPRASIMPRNGSGQSSMTVAPVVDRITRSSATSIAPRAIISSASADFPLPDAPVMRTALSPKATAVACRICGAGSGMARPKAAGRRQSARQAVRTWRPLRSGGYSPPRSHHHALRRSAWRSRVPSRNCCRNPFQAVASRSV